MKTFESEFKEVADWFNTACEELAATDFHEGSRQDGKYTVESKKLVREYNRRVIELCKKYNREVKSTRDWH